MLFELDLFETRKAKKKLESERLNIVPTLIHASDLDPPSAEVDIRSRFEYLQWRLDASDGQMADPWSIYEREYQRFMEGGPTPYRISKIITSAVAGKYSLDWLLGIERTIEAIRLRFAHEKLYGEGRNET